jgi:DNA excision repair protein ERCC-1
MASNEDDEDEAVLRSVLEESRRTAAASLPVESPSKRNQPVEELDEGIAAALAKLRESGG